MSDKPLFIPLNKEHYERFERGEKVHEYRAYGARWNERTCPPGRKVVLSCGYGKKRRMKGVIYKANICFPTNAFTEIYGIDKQCFAIHIVELENI